MRDGGATDGRRLTVGFFMDFAEDHRQSMDVYARSLGNALQTICGDEFEMHYFHPKSRLVSTRRGGNPGLWPMRVARYVSYPWQARNPGFDIHHIMDHGYAHLVGVLKPESTVVTVHDMIPVLRWLGAMPGCPRSTSKPRLSLLSLKAARRAAHIIAVSESTRRDLIEHLQFDPASISVVPNGLDEAFRPLPESAKRRLRQKLGWVDDAHARRLLVTGDAFYKNHETALEVFREVKRRVDYPLRLVKSGYPSPTFERLVVESGLADSVERVNLDHADMPALYNIVDCLLFPSWYEGFGLPPLEAMACGTPVVVSDQASLPEVVGPEIPVYDPRDVEGMRAAVSEVLDSPERRSQQVAAGLARARLFSWRRTACATADVYRGAVQAIRTGS